MKFMLLLLILSFLFESCQGDKVITSQKDVIKLEFTHTALPAPIFYTLKFSTGDTVQIKDHITSQAETFTYSILTKQERSTLDSLINDMNLSALDTSYDSGVIDGDVYLVTISKNDTLKAIRIHGGDIPDKLVTLTDYLTGLKKKLEPQLLKKS